MLRASGRSFVSAYSQLDVAVAALPEGLRSPRTSSIDRWGRLHGLAVHDFRRCFLQTLSPKEDICAQSALVRPGGAVGRVRVAEESTRGVAAGEPEGGA
jgi:hypothetical protein